LGPPDALHTDHFDPAAIRSVAKESGFYVLALDSKAAAVASRGFRVYPVKTFEPLAFGDVTMTAVPAVDGFNETQVSWIVSAGRKRIFHGGDTLWHGSFWAYGRQYGPLDAAFLPINGAKLKGWQPFSDIEGTMTPKQAVAAAIVMSVKLVIPIHYGFHDPQSYLEHPNALGEFEETARARKQPFRILKPGEQIEI
jgi:L-ascorbate metabolism protein UlaG (beta-lactamase superfamily)